jgi:hypothetical protein
MAVRKPKVMLQALTSFVTTDDKGVQHFIRQGETVASDHPAAKGREELFAEYDPAVAAKVH